MTTDHGLAEARTVRATENRPSERVFVEVTRVAKDGSWTDIRCFTWACSWAKRMRSWPPLWAVEATWSALDLQEQEWDWVRKRDEEKVDAGATEEAL